MRNSTSFFGTLHDSTSELILKLKNSGLVNNKRRDEQCIDKNIKVHYQMEHL
jgi:hypothetical protein